MTLKDLIPEKNLAEALGVSVSTLRGYRLKGCPWINVGGHAFYLESDFMEWVTTARKRVADQSQTLKE